MGSSGDAASWSSARSLATVQEIEQAISGLTPKQRAELLLWVDEQFSTTVDELVREDLLAGRFDDRLDLALAEDAPGKTRAL